MIQTIVSLFGYTKIPLAAVQLSMVQEEFFRKAIEGETDKEMIEFITPYLEGQKALTEFLRSGRLLRK